MSLAALVALVVGLGATGDAPTRWILLPPLVAAVTVLAIAAVAVDYFGVRRRRRGWRGIAVDPRAREAASVRSRALDLRFGALKKAGDPRTPATARALLFALAESDRLADAGAVVDFLSADATFTRVGNDVVADALRAMALAELGRTDEARALVGELAARRRSPAVVEYAGAHVAGHSGDLRGALARIDALSSRRRARHLRRELAELRARLLSDAGRYDEAVAALRALAAGGHRPAVEQLLDRARDRGHGALAQAALSALNQASPYR